MNHYCPVYIYINHVLLWQQLIILYFKHHRHNTKDPRPNKAECTNCETVISDWLVD